MNSFPNITEQRKAELIRCAEILQDADRLDILRYDIENPRYQRFLSGRLNNLQSVELIAAVIELNTRQAINKGYLQIKEDEVQLKRKARTGEKIVSRVNRGMSHMKIKFEERNLNSDLQELSSGATISGFN